DMGPTISHRVVVRLSSVLRFLYACFGDLQDLHSFPTRRSADEAQEPPVGRPGPSRLSAHLDTSCDEAVRGPVSSLAHVRVLDLSRQLPGPFCSTLLADLGADVLAIAAPDDPFGVGMPLLAR